MDIYQKLHGTTVDRFQIGTKSEKIVLTGTTTGSEVVDLQDRDNNFYTLDSSAFYDIKIFCEGTERAAWKLEGCYVQGQFGLQDSIVTTYINTNSINTPTVTVNSPGELTVTVSPTNPAVNLSWVAVIDLIKI